MKKQMSRWLLMLLLAMSCCVMLPKDVEAAQWYEDEWYNSNGDIYDDSVQEETYSGDTQEENLTVYYGEKGTLPAPTSWTDNLGLDVRIAFSEFTLENTWDNILNLDQQGNYEVMGVGTAEAEGRFYDASGRLLLTKTYYITAKADMTGVKLDKTSVKSYVQKGYYYMSSRFEVHLKSADKPLPDSMYNYDVSCSSSNPEIYVEAYMADNRTVVIYAMGTGKTTVTLVINEKEFHITLQIIEVGINKNSLLLTVKQTSQLRVTGLKQGVKWSSSSPGVVKVSSDGTVRALKTGNAVIKAKVGDFTVGCAVSVVSPERYQTIRQAVRIASSGTYSQEKRMQKGYYDCSSLTWSAYKRSGINFGSSYYAPVAADQAKWCMQRKKYIKGGLSEANIQNMKLNAGDLMFEEGADNGRYRNIYHVEMIRGYTCYGFDEQGKAILGIAWANRPDGYYWPCGQLVCRP